MLPLYIRSIRWLTTALGWRHFRGMMIISEEVEQLQRTGGPQSSLLLPHGPQNLVSRISSSCSCVSQYQNITYRFVS